MRYSFIIAALILAGCALPRNSEKPASSVQQQEDDARMIQTAYDLKNKTQENYKILPGDLLTITVFREPDLSRDIRVGSNGTTTFPMAGNLKLAGLSVPEIETLLVRKLSDVLVSPQVTVLIKEYSSQQIYVLGEVSKPGAITLPTERKLTVLEAITMAGGFTELAAQDRTKVLRNSGGQNQSFEIKISKITKGGDKSLDMTLESNDTIFVPQSFF